MFHTTIGQLGGLVERRSTITSLGLGKVDTRIVHRESSDTISSLSHLCVVENLRDRILTGVAKTIIIRVTGPDLE